MGTRDVRERERDRERQKDRERERRDFRMLEGGKKKKWAWGGLTVRVEAGGERDREIVCVNFLKCE